MGLMISTCQEKYFHFNEIYYVKCIYIVGFLSEVTISISRQFIH